MATFMTNYISKNWLTVVLAVIGGISPMSISVENLPAATISLPPAVAPLAYPTGIKAVHHSLDQFTPGVAEQTYTYMFQGKAVNHGEPCANARVTLEIVTPRSRLTRHAVTAKDGSYAIALSIQGWEQEPVDWQISGVSSDLKTVEYMGRHILMDDPAITVGYTLEFAD